MSPGVGYSDVSEVEVGDVVICREKRKAVVTGVSVVNGAVYHRHLDNGSNGECLFNKCLFVSKKGKEGKKMLQSIKEYFEKHKDVVMTLAIIVVADHFLFDGALRERIKAVIDGMLKKVENRGTA